MIINDKLERFVTFDNIFHIDKKTPFSKFTAF